MSKVNEISMLMGQNSFDARLAADVFTKWICPDVYAWLQGMCHIWTWLGIPLLAPDDPCIAQFAEQDASTPGEIETPHHVAWVAGVKR